MRRRFCAASAMSCSAQAAASWQWQYDHTLRCWNAATYDGNANGNTEIIWIDANRDCRLDTVAFDTNGSDWLLEQMWSDVNGDGRWDVVFMDTNQAVGFEYYFVDRDGNGTWETHGWLANLQVQTSTGYVSGGSMVIGPPTNPSGFYNLMITMAAITGRATY